MIDPVFSKEAVKTAKLMLDELLVTIALLLKENQDLRNRITVLEGRAADPDEIRKSQTEAAMAALKEPSHGTGSGGTGRSEGTERHVGGPPPAEAGGEAGRPALG